MNLYFGMTQKSNAGGWVVKKMFSPTSSKFRYVQYTHYLATGAHLSLIFNDEQRISVPELHAVEFIAVDETKYG